MKTGRAVPPAAGSAAAEDEVDMRIPWKRGTLPASPLAAIDDGIIGRCSTRFQLRIEIL
jgi:hypothetical protein